ncbi:MAG: YceI family protein [Flavobacteriales bacterium]
MKKWIMVAAVAALFSFTALEAGKWALDSSHSRLGFTLTHMGGIAEVQGAFGKVDATIATNGSSTKDFNGAVIELTADANTINTGFAMRDEHLQGEDYFDAAKFPTLTFKSTSMEKVKGSEKEYAVKGDLTMRGVTKQVEFKAVHNGNINNKYGEVAGFKVTGAIKRSDFGIGASLPTSVASDEITLNADVEITKQ